MARAPEGAPPLKLPFKLRLPKVNQDLVTVLLVIGAAAGLLGVVRDANGQLIYGVSIVQYLINGVVIGSIYVLGATGLSLIFGIRRFANFAHGEMMTFGAYIALFVSGARYLRLDIFWGFLFAIIATAILAMLLETIVFRKLAGRGPVPLLVASIGVAIFLQNLVAASFGTEITTYNLRTTVNIVLLTVDGAPVLSINAVKGIATLLVSGVLILGLHVLLKYTTLGKAMRATADNPDLARASGVNTRNVILWTWAIGGALAAVAGVLLGVALDVRTTLGFNVLLFVFAAVIVGGLGSPYGAMLGGMVVGIAQELSVAFLAWLGRPDVLDLSFATAYKPIAAFAIMIIVLLIRPGGLAGGKVSMIRSHGLRLRISRMSFPKLPWGRSGP
ncbi:MAG TPA: branched-chain amino acid ABC transporter permease [Thermoplasmata archaeon]|jgi:branched-chain amino acid transport system permease protein/neutral amino acid transport system permease protein|nr:branched-chain amino acid ABC transporter permease [Thermoplasmata archaeon]